MATKTEPKIDDVDKWFEDYKPLPNHFDPNASWSDGEHGVMFETYGEEQDYVYAYDHKYVWTYMDVDGGTAIVAGRSFVNRIGYFITEIPWESGDEYVQVDEDTDDIECECGNTPHSDGFYPCLPDGTEVEPVIGGDWDGESYVCGRCGTICVG